MIRKLVIPTELGGLMEVRLLEWLKKEGDIINAGDAVLEFETDKAIVLVTASQAGFLRKCCFAAGDWMKPDDVAAWLSDQPDETLPADGDAAAATLQVTFDVT